MKITAHDIATIGLRLLAIFLLVQAIPYLPTILFLTQLFNQTVTTTSTPSTGLILTGALMPIVMITIPILLWIFSAKIVRVCLKYPAAENGDNKAVSDLQTLLFCSIGIAIFILSLPEFIKETLYIILPISHGNYRYTAAGFVDLTMPLLKMGLSLVLILKAKSLSDWLS